MGTTFNMVELNPGTWFDVEGGGRICLRICGSDKLREIRKQTVKKKIEYKQGGRFVYDEVNEDLQGRLIWEYCIVNWENFFDADGKPIPCNIDTKNALMGNSPMFSKMVTANLTKLADIEEAEDQEAKN